MTDLPSLFDPDLILDEIDPDAVARGRRYQRERRVLSADYDPRSGLVSGRVRGSAGRVYQCLIKVVEGPGTHPLLLGHCSCPVGVNCKHVAAVLLSVQATSEHAPLPAPSRTLPTALRLWLERAERARSVSDQEPFRLHYLLECEESIGLRRTRVRAVKVRRLLSGGDGKPQEFNILSRSRASFIGPDDQRVMALLEGAGSAGEGHWANLNDVTGVLVMAAILATGRGHFHTIEAPVLRAGGDLAGRLVWRLGEDAQLHVVVETDRPGVRLLPMAPPWWLDPESGECGPLATGLDDRAAGLLAAAPAVAPVTVAALTDVVRERFQDLTIPLPKQPERRRIGAGQARPRLRLLSVDRAGTSLDRFWGIRREPQWTHRALLDFDYGGKVVDPRDPASLIERVEQEVLVEVERDTEAERRAIALLEGLGMRRVQVDPEPDGMAFERADPETWIEFVQHDLARLESHGWLIHMDAGFHFRIAELDDWEVEILEGEGGRWLDLALGVNIDGARTDLLPLLVDLIQRYQSELSTHALARLDDDQKLQLRLTDGRLVLMPVQRLRPILATLLELYDSDGVLRASGGGPRRLRLARAEAARLSTLESAAPGLRWRGGERARDWARRLSDFNGVDPVTPPAGLTTTLRQYQLEGLSWLQFLRAYDLGGILADDMGLGKTVQTLAHLLLERESGRAERPSLVVAPTSLLFNWRREAARFAPALRVLSLHGIQRHQAFAAIPDHDVILTTYPLLPRDQAALAEHHYHLLVLDEAQTIKNPRSKAAQVVRTLQARHRLCLTGTPMENHLGELWALLDFLIPELLGDESRFRRLFRIPIEREGDTLRQEELRRRVAPFLLRRTKDAVAAELPPKTEIVREVPLADDQRDLYETLRLALHEKVREEVARRGLSRSGIVILDALLKLRQVCCDPRLVALESARRVRGSAKLDLLMTLLPDLVAEGRRVLVFSQFTSMLALIEDELIKLGLVEDQGFVKLTGRTRNRDRPVDRFQSGAVSLFLISLKAGGTGLNLTAADTVIHYDPWWNPAVERQATDRAHRIGQDKPVFVYKLLTEGTVEQRVADLQARKQALADAMLAGGGAASGLLSADDLALLFAPIETT